MSACGVGEGACWAPSVMGLAAAHVAFSFSNLVKDAQYPKDGEVSSRQGHWSLGPHGAGGFPREKYHS